MKSGNPIESIAESIYSALYLHLPDIEYLSKTPQQMRDGADGVMKKRRLRIDEINVYVFPQTWGSTALGFGGIGGQAITTAYTVVVCSETHASVFFGGGHAYTLPITRKLMADIHEHRMERVSFSNKYIDNEG